MSNGYRPVYTLSGSDAVEVAIKLAFAYHKKKGNKRNKIVSFDDAYHGATLLSLTCGDVGLEGAYCGMKPYTEVIKTSPDLKQDIDWNDVSCIVIETCPHYHNASPYGFDFWEKINQIQTKNFNPFQNKQIKNNQPSNKMKATSLRSFLSKGLGFLIKKIFNFFLNIFSLGSTLEVICK